MMIQTMGAEHITVLLKNDCSVGMEEGIDGC